MKKIFFYLNFIFYSIHSYGLTLNEAVEKSIKDNPEIHTSESEFKAQEYKQKQQSFLSNPTVGLMVENKPGSEQTAMGGPMKTWYINQEILFPAKYFLSSSSEFYIKNAKLNQLTQKKWEIRRQVIDKYIQLYTLIKIQQLLSAQKETLREISRAAESRKASGGSSQQDEMKSHVEQTKIEAELILQNQEIIELKNELMALLNKDDVNIDENLKIESPKINQKYLTFKDNINLLPTFLEKKSMMDASEKMLDLAYFSYAPDFMLSYKKPYENAPEGAYTFEVGIKIPLWFFSQNRNEVGMKRAQFIADQNQFLATKLVLQAKYNGLKSKIENSNKLLEIYETTLIPQASSALNSSRAAYSAGRIPFADYLDSERSFYDVKIKYYDYFAKRVMAITEMEAILGNSTSDLPDGGMSAQ